MEYKHIVAAVAVLGLGLTACVDEVSLGNDFLEKPASSSATSDTVFSKPEYFKQLLTTLYSFQYFGIPYRNTSSDTYPQESSNIYVGKVDMLTDLYSTDYEFGLRTSYIRGQHSANDGVRSDKFSYLDNRVWQAVRYAYLIIENADDVPGLSAELAEQYKAEAKCILASRYFDVFRNYGGVPIIRSSFDGDDESYDMPRSSVREFVSFAIGLLDEAAAVLPWVRTENETGRWTSAAAKALKCRILQFVASPLFNSDEPYHQAGHDNPAVWLGGYDASWWNKLLSACEDLAKDIEVKGHYALVTANGVRPEDYRLAYRNGYLQQGSTEVFLSVRHFDKITTNSMQQWFKYSDFKQNVQRGYIPTEEYAEMFPWADGTPFDFEKTEADGRLDEMFVTGIGPDGSTDNLRLTRDPRLYEEAAVNGMPSEMDWDSGNMSGQIFETWVGGTHGLNHTTQQRLLFHTGYGPAKFVLDTYGRYFHWPAIRLSDFLLTYAEALAQTGNLAGAVKHVDKVRARVGLRSLAEATPSVLTDKGVLLEEILRERACELGMEDSRFYDLVRYKRKDIFEKRLHGLRIYRIAADGSRTETKWYDGGQTAPYPTHFEYERFELDGPSHEHIRAWWTEGFDPKWYLSPFPQTEVNKNYGLVQNPGW